MQLSHFFTATKTCPSHHTSEDIATQFEEIFSNFEISDKRCVKIYLHQTMKMVFIFFLRIFQDNCNRDYFQCNRNRACGN